MALTVDMIGPSPYGFRIYGGRDFKKALVITKVHVGSKAEQANLQAGDIIVEINKEDTAEMLNAEAQNKIKNSKTNLSLSILRYAFTHISAVALSKNLTPHPPQKNNPPKKQKTNDFSPDRPPVCAPSLQDKPLPAPLQPIRHSVTLICPPLHAANSYEFSNEEFLAESEVAKMMQENKESGAPPRQSSTFKVLQEALETDEKALFNQRHLCHTLIETEAVRIGDNRYRHPECYTCNDCGLNLKMRGHFWVGDVMYCEKHAKERYQGPFRSKSQTN
uniref:PDZ and LIM domain protein 2 n=1 Tax=Kryptolebias marmoratus TaxID=37003 RepID=A0A3Q2ZV75_KRYMA